MSGHNCDYNGKLACNSYKRPVLKYLFLVHSMTSELKCMNQLLTHSLCLCVVVRVKFEWGKNLNQLESNFTVPFSSQRITNNLLACRDIITKLQPYKALKRFLLRNRFCSVRAGLHSTFGRVAFRGYLLWSLDQFLPAEWPLSSLSTCGIGKQVNKLSRILLPRSSKKLVL